MVQGVTHRIRLPSVPSNLVLNITKRTQLLLPALLRPALWHRHLFPPSPYHILSYLLCMSSFVFKSLGSDVNRFSSYIQLKHRVAAMTEKSNETAGSQARLRYHPIFISDYQESYFTPVESSKIHIFNTKYQENCEVISVSHHQEFRCTNWTRNIKTFAIHQQRGTFHTSQQDIPPYHSKSSCLQWGD